ncbi:TonB-dependent receptor [Algibacter sp. L4_22]|uniref:SusC/RagA family TonB-linked outer membrane protein n=1 Tax=Algibacter sp. L4_22 TaxID=2942477 RepID=UPI00201B76D6|nr:TonB-dependent receptor [Algibacter sp. L4_22]MCL5129268.1 TonB-dependent receptor [Algibacter sp. L4_22]
MKQLFRKQFQLILFICFFSTYHGNASSQNINTTNLTLNEQGVTLVHILSTISNKTDFNITYGDFIASNNKKYNAIYKNESLNLILKDLSKRAQFSFKVNDLDILIGKALSKTNIGVIQQNVKITGNVIDEMGMPLLGANIVEKGTTNGVTTDYDGKFALTVSNSNSSIIVSYIGYANQELDLNGKTNIGVTLKIDDSKLDEVLIVGYGSVKKSDLTGSVSSVSSKDLVAFPVSDATQALQGRASGVLVQSTNGAPGSEYSIQIRGNTSINAGNDPLIVVDGFIGGIMPPSEDIKSMEILKDASSTAIYGARGANGVVIVSTKRGTTGKAKFSFSSSYATQTEINRLDLLNADQFTDYIQELDPDFIPELTGIGTNWQDEIYKTGSVQNNQLSVSGGTNKLSYYLSGAVFDQEGIVVDSDFKRYSITSNLDLEASDNIKLGSSIFVRRTNRNGVKSQEGGDAAQTGVISSAYKFSPTQGIRDINGDYALSVVGFPIDNPYALSTEYQNEAINDLFQGNVYAEIGVAKDLNFKSTLGVSINNSRTGQYYPTTLDRGNSVGGEATLNTRKSTSFINENYLNYSKLIGKVHDLSIMVGYSLQKDRSETSNSLASGFISDSFSYWNLGAGTNVASVDSELSETTFEAFFGRINYTLNNKYLFTFTGRNEGSSVFAKNNKYGFFPSAAFGWKISDENFLSNSNTISLLKLRLSYGKVGNQAISPYQSLASFTDVFTTVQGSAVTAIRPSTISNNDLSWETTAQTNIGLDLEILKNRFALTLDYYNMKTTDLLFNVPTPNYTGFQTQLQNIGTVENKGFEFALNANIFQDEFKWKTYGNISFNRNKIIKLVENDTEGNDIYYSSNPLSGGGTTQLLREGESVGQFWGYIYDGVVQSADEVLIGGEDVGGEKFIDLNGDGELTDDDRAVIGDPHPDFNWGWSNDFSYKNLSLNVFIQGVQGGEIMNYTLMELGALNGRTNVTTDALNRWTPTNTDTNIPQARISRSFVTSDRWIDDASYVRLKNISLGYNFPEDVLTKINLSAVRLHVSGQNLLTLTSYKGVDPEVSYSNSSSNIGLDYGSYPNVKSITFGLNIEF